MKNLTIIGSIIDSLINSLVEVVNKQILYVLKKCIRESKDN